ncbi:unnamed protein product [Cunninghamella echinulata]
MSITITISTAIPCNRFVFISISNGTQYQPSSIQQDTTQVYDPQYQQQQQQTGQQWQQFDPNIHYYYDEQGQYHYYDPNTGQEYDYSQYTYDSNNYNNNSYDPQYYNSQQYNTDPFNLQNESSTTAPITTNNMDNDVDATSQTQQYSQEQQHQHISSTVETTTTTTTTVASTHHISQGDSLDYSIPSAQQETVDITQVTEQQQINHGIANTSQVESVAYESSAQVNNNDMTGNGVGNSVNYSIEERKASIPLIKSTSQQWDQVDVNDQQNISDQSIINGISQVTTATTTTITNDNNSNVMNGLTDDLDDLILGDKQNSVLQQQVQPEVNNNNALPDYSNYNATATPPTNTTSVYGPTYFPSGTISRQMSPVENVNSYNGIITNNNNSLSRSGTPKLPGTENTTPLICINTSCQAKNKQASKFCEECGTPFVINESRASTPINNIPISASTSTSLHAQSAYNRAYSPPIQEQGYNQPTFSSVYQQEQQQINPPLERSITPTLYNNQRPLTPSNSNSLYSAPYQHRNSIPTTTPLSNSAYDPAPYTNTNTNINNTPNNFTSTMDSHHQQPYIPNPYDVTSTPTTNIENTNPLNYSSNLVQQQQVSTRLPVSQDPLKRYMGAPLVSFGFGGKLCMMFPRSTQPHYTNTNAYGNGYNDNNNNNATSKRLPGAIQLKSIKDTLVNHPLLSKKFDESLLSVSPVLSDPNFSIKNKKKQVIGFMEQRINEFKNEASANQLDVNTKILLWTLVKMMIEHDGSLLDSETSMKYITSLFQSNMEIKNDTNSFSVPAYNGQLYDGQQQQQNGQIIEDDRSEVVLDKLQNYLEQGDRRGAVIYAMQEDLWSHALVISSCVDRELWQTVVRGFTQRDLAMSTALKQERVYHNITGNRQALRVLYALFSGSGATAMSEFITTDKQQNHNLGNHLQQQQQPTPQLEEHELSKWKETLGLILANRTARDFEAITSLGDILVRHGWVYAAHVCYILSPQSSIFSGLDTPYVRYTLLGTSQIERYSITEGEGILLTELMEFGSSLRSGNSGECFPFLQGYKLVHAWWLADIGLVNEASRYCDAIQQCIKSYNKDSPYLHQYLSGKVKELSEFCSESSGKKQARRDVTSWLKPTFKKNTLDSLWGSIEGRFNKFVSGDDTQAQEEPTGRKSTEIMASPFDGTIEPPARSVSAIDFRMQQSTTTQSYFKRFK